MKKPFHIISMCIRAEAVVFVSDMMTYQRLLAALIHLSVNANKWLHPNPRIACIEVRTKSK